MLTDESISRVHLMLLRIDDVLYAIDTGSSNGMWRTSGDAGGDSEWQRVRVVAMEAGMLLSLGSERACVTWEPAG